ncbi:uncharacterized protein G2W53_007134 [Senna tora]|uniref:Uncharacterized protein n=1 Tax=Senna tora TaxID=362788 RepID=A0A835CH27_9FABA|nr:uncharacterized protein G2W53_007134 [Senna tora]
MTKFPFSCVVGTRVPKFSTPRSGRGDVGHCGSCAGRFRVDEVGCGRELLCREF